MYIYIIFLSPVLTKCFCHCFCTKQSVVPFLWFRSVTWSGLVLFCLVLSQMDRWIKTSFHVDMVREGWEYKEAWLLVFLFTLLLPPHP